ncbi:MAG: hypothetical protein WCD79_03995 [Chthoniobacteraceae bacterium]
MSEPFKVTGGARVGWVNASSPLAKLTATPDSLRVSIRILGNYAFTPETVVSITRHTMIPVLAWGIRIQHCVPEYPAGFIFWSLGNPDKLLAGIREAGFIPQAPESAIPPRQGFAFRWQVIVIVLAAWYGPYIFDLFFRSGTLPIPGITSLVVLGLSLTTAIATIRIPAFQRLILKPGRHIGEIRPFLNLLILIGSILFIAFAIICAFNLGSFFQLQQ